MGMTVGGRCSAIVEGFVARVGVEGDRFRLPLGLGYPKPLGRF